ncbi:rod shape-determining protein MreD [Patescibacteria group bacterium]|nr:rod shape-determining protein MreD [Patescibacteria group bacterium]MBU1877263.1 rod shape-determining protein MreD [Patescibacteria group bacterium]
MKKYLFFILFFYLLSLLETSFFIHFRIFSFLPSLILISQVLIVFLEHPNKNYAVFSAFCAGFFWDIFSNQKLGTGILLMISLTVLLKLILKKYVRIPSIRKF